MSRSAELIGVAVEGFTVTHVLVHLVPVYSGDELDPSRAASLPDDDPRRLGGLLREAFDM